jgi:hypothetical protein
MLVVIDKCANDHFSLAILPETHLTCVKIWKNSRMGLKAGATLRPAKLRAHKLSQTASRWEY